MPRKYDYDAIIIGAGIGGLVCGCYLAKAGMKTLIVEKNEKAGGYCTSFVRNGYRFDACVHFLSTLRKEGRFHKILYNLGILNKLKFTKHDPSDIIITPNCRVRLFKDINRTLVDFYQCFPKEKENVTNFCNYVVSSSIVRLMKVKNIVFQELLNSYFKDDSLKLIFSTLILGLAGYPSHQISALVACLILREFILFDGGYYPEGGMQAFADALVSNFIDNGGKIVFKHRVEKILIRHKKAEGVVVQKGCLFSAKYIISACDARQTYFYLVGKELMNKELVEKVNNFIPSYSAFSVYLGMDDKFRMPEELRASIWFINSNDSREVFDKMLKCESLYLGITSPSIKTISSKKEKQSLCLLAPAPFVDKNYWNNKQNRETFESKLISLGEKVLPGCSKHISLKFNATPLSLYNWTLNYNGAAYGWAGKANQFCSPDMPGRTMVQDLYSVGHWTNMGSGISSVANSGFDAAKIIIRLNSKK